MKQIILFTVLVAISAASSSQEINPAKPITRLDYLEKSKNQKTTAWVLLGGGAALDIIAFATFPKDYIMFEWGGEGNSSSTESKANTSAALFLVGSASMLASIPFFISSRVNNKRAISVTIDTKQLHQLKKTNIYTVNYPVLTMKIRL
jgi:hypothetical protein